MPTTAKHALRYPALTDAADVPLRMQQLAEDVDGLMSIMRTGVTGSRPAAGKLGQWYKDTTTGGLAFDNGSAWEEVVRGTDARLANERVPVDDSVTPAKVQGARFSNLIGFWNFGSFLVGANQSATLVTSTITTNHPGSLVVLAGVLDGHMSSATFGGVSWSMTVLGVSTAFLWSANVAAGFVGPLARMTSLTVPTAGTKNITIQTSLGNNPTSWSSQAGGFVVAFEVYN